MINTKTSQHEPSRDKHSRSARTCGSQEFGERGGRKSIGGLLLAPGAGVAGMDTQVPHQRGDRVERDDPDSVGEQFRLDVEDLLTPALGPWGTGLPVRTVGGVGMVRDVRAEFGKFRDEI